jgi:formylglycine-generating enzyme required for sulfatase activity
MRFLPALLVAGLGVLVLSLPAAPLPFKVYADTYTNSVGMIFHRVHPGEFAMGPPSSGDERSDREPNHKVRITRPYFLGVYEVTQGEYEKVMSTNPSYHSKKGEGKDRIKDVTDPSRLPVESVTWAEAMEFCGRLSAVPADRNAGRVYRLPTEAEWEYACRAEPPGGPYLRFSRGNELPKKDANFSESGIGRPVPVGTYVPNGWGFYEMHGNVGEWCLDWYDETYYQRSPAADPRGPDGGEFRVWRGGDYTTYAWGCRSVNRNAQTPTYRTQCRGFRVVMVERGR